MPTLTDVRFDTLRALGYAGATSDMLLGWLQNGGPGAPVAPTGPLKTIPDAWRSVLLGLLDPVAYPPEDYHRNDYWYAYLGLQGYTGAMNDRELAYWLALFESATGGAYSAAYSEAYG